MNKKVKAGKMTEARKVLNVMKKCLTIKEAMVFQNNMSYCITGVSPGYIDTLADKVKQTIKPFGPDIDVYIDKDHNEVTVYNIKHRAIPNSLKKSLDNANL